jgi:hypothetical protein
VLIKPKRKQRQTVRIYKNYENIQLILILLSLDREAIITKSAISKPNSKIRQNSNNKQDTLDLKRATSKPSNPKSTYKTRQNTNDRQDSLDLEPTMSKPSNPKSTYKTRQNTNDRQDSLDLEPTTSRSSIPKPLKPGKTSNDKQDDFKLDLSSHELSDEDMAIVVRDAFKNNQVSISPTTNKMIIIQLISYICCFFLVGSAGSNT